MKWRRRDEWDPFKDLFDLQKEINRLFETSFSRLPQRFISEESFAPAIDLYEDENEYVVEAELPGLKQDEIKVSVEDDILTISGEKKREKEVKEGNLYRSERFYGKFERQIVLPQNTEKDNIKASYKNGVLKVVIPKKEEAKPKRVDIKVE
ncbi:MAG: Hsp20/alpha crystallin family protein [Candidatus Omnitrophota bacterium]|nr:MAG: Hsp20/alpha crystallin family protein [Candidatus Omnitrophota bacterium]